MRIMITTTAFIVITMTFITADENTTSPVSKRSTFPAQNSIEFSFRSKKHRDEFVFIGRDDNKTQGENTLHPCDIYRIPGDIDPKNARHPKNAILRYTLNPPGEVKLLKNIPSFRILIENDNLHKGFTGSYATEGIKNVPGSKWLPAKKIRVPVNVKGLDYYIIPFRIVGEEIQSVHIVFSDDIKKIQHLLRVDEEANNRFGWKVEHCIVPDCFQESKSLKKQK